LLSALFVEEALMLTGPKGEKRPADVIGNAVKVMRIATGDEQETGRDPAKELQRKGGLKGSDEGMLQI
jgi:hypothetical protein